MYFTYFEQAANECHGCRETRARSCESVGHGLERSSTRVLVSGLFSRSGSEFGVMWVYWTGLNIGDKFPAVLVWLNRYMPSRTSRHSGIARYALNPWLSIGGPRVILLKTKSLIWEIIQASWICDRLHVQICLMRGVRALGAQRSQAAKRWLWASIYLLTCHPTDLCNTLIHPSSPPASHPAIHLSSLHPSIYLSIDLSLYTIHPLTHASISPSIYRSTYLPIDL